MLKDSDKHAKLLAFLDYILGLSKLPALLTRIIRFSRTIRPFLFTNSQLFHSCLPLNFIIKNSRTAGWYIHLSFLHGLFALSRSSVSSVILKRNVILSVCTPCTTLHLRNDSALSAVDISSAIFDGSVSLLCFMNSFLILCLPASKARVSSLKTFSRALWSDR